MGLRNEIAALAFREGSVASQVAVRIRASLILVPSGKSSDRGGATVLTYFRSIVMETIATTQCPPKDE